MQEYFADTWYLVAIADRFDMHHADARRVKALVGNSRLVTHDGVLTEVLAYFSGGGPFSRQRAVSVARDALRDFTVVPADRALFLAALDRYSARVDKEYSLVDCMSMVVMEQRGIRHVLTNDHHFTQAGFVVVNQ
ncbi:MAG TPA: PIN domain-containing protein [Thermoanaerobaculia bacterium]|nr:PIN domain-containing protein [Thermoanaerobaculia bacterium]